MALLLLYLCFYAAFAGLLWKAASLWAPPSDKQARATALPPPAFWILGLGAVLFAAGFAGAERWVRTFDHAGYYQGTVYVARTILSDPWGAAPEYLKRTIETEEYNALLCFWLAEPMRLWGVDIPLYTVLLALLGLLPFAYLVLAFGQRQARVWQAPERLGVLAGALGFFLPAVYLPFLLGMADVAVLPFATVALLAAVRLLEAALEDVPLRKVPAGVWVALAVTLFVMPLLRRYFAVYALALFPALGLSLMVGALTGRLRWSTVIRYGLALGVLAAGIGCTWYKAFPGFFTNSFLKQYADIYQAYRYGDLALEFHYILNQIGPLVWVLAGFGVLALSVGPGSRLVGLMLALHIGLTLTGILRIQSLGQHHYYLILGPVALLAVAGALSPWLWARQRGDMARRAARFVIGGLALALAACWASVTPTFEASPRFLTPFRTVASTVYLYPRRNPDLSTLREVAGDVRRMNPFGRLKVYVAGSSGSYNDDVLRNLDMPDHSPGLPGLLDGRQHVHVDRRDAFPTAFLRADLVVAPVPMQYHLRPEDQRLATWVQQAVTDSAGLGRFYTLEKTYPMNGFELRLYARRAPLPLAEVARSLAPIRAAYPDFPAMYQLPAQQPAEAGGAQPGDGPYAFAEMTEDGQHLSLHPGKTLPSRLTVRFAAGGQLRLTPRFAAPCKEGSAVVLVVRAKGIVQDSLVVDQAAMPTLQPFPIQPDEEVELRVYPGPKADFCDHLYVDFGLLNL